MYSKFIFFILIPLTSSAFYFEREDTLNRFSRHERMYISMFNEVLHGSITLDRFKFADQVLKDVNPQLIKMSEKLSKSESFSMFYKSIFQKDIDIKKKCKFFKLNNGNKYGNDFVYYVDKFSLTRDYQSKRFKCITQLNSKDFNYFYECNKLNCKNEDFANDYLLWKYKFYLKHILVHKGLNKKNCFLELDKLNVNLKNYKEFLDINNEKYIVFNCFLPHLFSLAFVIKDGEISILNIESGGKVAQSEVDSLFMDYLYITFKSYLKSNNVNTIRELNEYQKGKREFCCTDDEWPEMNFHKIENILKKEN